MKYLFGPVNSRRLGLSLGIDLLVSKTCNFNCIYCEIGAATIFTCERKEYTPTANIISEIDTLIATQSAATPIDIFTITGSGEPTLHSGLGKIIGHLKKKTAQPVAVLTNGSLLHLADVRTDLGEADIVIPSLDSAREESFQKINRPAGSIKLEQVIQGLEQFSREFSGEFWLEILIVKGINDTPEDISALKKALTIIKPGKVQLNTVARPPLENYAEALSQKEMESIAAQLPGKVEIIVSFAQEGKGNTRNANKSEILHILQRRPCTALDICKALNLDKNSTIQALDQLEKSGSIDKKEHKGKEYYQVTMHRRPMANECNI